MKTKQTLIFLTILILSLSLVSAADFTPSGDINGRDVYDIKNFIEINATTFNGDGSGLTNLPASVLSNASVNSTQMYVDGSDKLNIFESWLESLFYIKSLVYTKTEANSQFLEASQEGDLNVNHSDTSTLAATATTWDGETSQANLNVNHSDTSGNANTVTNGVYTTDFPLNQDTTGNAGTVTNGVYTTDFPLNQDTTGNAATATLATDSTAWIVVIYIKKFRK